MSNIEESSISKAPSDFRRALYLLKLHLTECSTLITDYSLFIFLPTSTGPAAAAAAAAKTTEATATSTAGPATTAARPTTATEAA